MSENDGDSGTPNETGGEADDFGAAVLGFREALQSAWSSPEAEQHVVEAFERYAASLWQAWQAPEVAEHAAAAYQDYAQGAQSAFAAPDARARIDDAFRRYAEQVKKAWSDIDAATITPEQMAAIVEGMSWVTGVVGMVRRAGEGQL